MKFFFPASITSISFDGKQYDAGDEDVIEVEDHEHRLIAHLRATGFEHVAEEAPKAKKAAAKKAPEAPNEKKEGE